MKIALCLHGLVGTNCKYGHGQKDIHHEVGYKHFKRHLIDINDQVDIFIHTWTSTDDDGDIEDELTETYSPVAIKTDLQPQFKTKEEAKEVIKAAMLGPTLPRSQARSVPELQSRLDRKQAIHCRWKSVQEVLNLVKQSDEDYDYILLTRFDIAFLVDFTFEDCDPSKFYAQGPPGPPKNGISLINDLWFFASPENMFKFATLFDHLGHDSYKAHLDSNHELARKHLIEEGINDKVEYRFKREWNGAIGKIMTDTPLVRWHYFHLLDESLKAGELMAIVKDRQAEYNASHSS